MRVLITNLFIHSNSGTETVSALLADGLRQAGHDVAVFAPTLGGLAQGMRARGHKVHDRIAEITEKPDVIHAHHLTPTLIAMARFPDVPIVFTCHSSFFEVEAPMLHPQIRQWVAVDEACRAKSLSHGVPSDRLSIIHNAVDLKRFKPRQPLPTKPVRGLLLTKNREHQQAVRQACAIMDISLDEMGPATGKISGEIEKDLVNYDIVFATARMAIEAATVGCAVIVCDARGFAGLLSTGNMKRWRDWNLGVGLLSEPTTIENVTRAISEYDAGDTRSVMLYMRSVAGLDAYIDDYVQIYQNAVEDHTPLNTTECHLASAHWIEELAVTSEKRKWHAIATELGQLQENNYQDVFLARLGDVEAGLRDVRRDAQESSVSVGNRLDATNDLLASINGSTAAVGRFTEQARNFYQALIPTSVRKVLYRWRQQ